MGIRLLFWTFFVWSSCTAQSYWPVASQRGLGNAALARTGMEGMAANPAAIAGQDLPVVLLFAEDRFGVGAFRRTGLHAATNWLDGGFGLMIGRYGNREYRELSLLLIYARTLSEGFSAGISAGFQQTYLPDHAGHFGLQAAAGFRWEWSDELVLAGALHNPFRIERSDWDRLPTRLGLGLGYLPHPQFTLLTEVEKGLDEPLTFRLGMEYRLHPTLIARLGVRPDPPMYTFGAGVRLFTTLRLDLAVQVIPLLPLSPSLGLSWRPRGKDSSAEE